MKNKWYESSALTIALCFLVFPIGLVLLGSNQKIKWFSKVLLSMTYVVIIAVFFIYYQPIPRKQQVSNISATTESIRYKINRFYTKELLTNGLKENVKPSLNEIFMCVEIEVTNSGDKKVFFVSLVDDPKIETSKDKYYPDLTLSQDPFGEINPGQTLSGFLVFRIPADEQLINFRISNLSKKIDF
ncbi:MAG: hypothetical protein C0412_10830 [Flavobacterium sp.]|nr:hypothetical protein [Flavobacterium sp.]